MTRARAAPRRASRDEARAPALEPVPAASDPKFVAGVSIALVAAAVTWIAFRARTGILLEDALITYRHAENLALGRGFGFNPGAAVLGTTSPLLTILLAALAKVAGVDRIPLLSNVLGILAGLGTGALVAGMLRRTGAGILFTTLTVLLLGMHPEIVWSTIGGLETPLVIFFMALGLDGVVRERWTRAAVASSLLVLTRIDGVVWAGILLGVAAFRLGPRVGKPAAVGLAVLAPWVVYAGLTFGSVVPHSVIAKRAIVYGSGEARYLPWVMNSLGITFVGDLTPFEFPLWFLFLAAGAAAIAGLAGRRAWAPIALFPAAFGAFLWLGRAPVFEWYTVPLTWCCLLVAAFGSLELRDMVASHAARRGWPARIASVVLAAAWITVGVGLGARFVAAIAHHRTMQQNEDGARRRVGEWIREHSRPEATVAMEAIGYQGTFSRRRVIDLAGIVSPEVVRWARESGSNAGTFDRVLTNAAPDFVVLRAYEVERNRHHHGGPLFESEAAVQRFAERYREALTVTAPHPRAWGDNARISVFARVASPHVLAPDSAGRVGARPSTTMPAR